MPPSTVSNKCIYALRAIFELALRGSDEPVSTHEIAAAQRIPQRFLEIILSELRHAGLLRSKRGNDGGYILARPARRITVADVIECVQGGNSRDPSAGAVSDATAEDAFADMWQQVTIAVSNVYNNTTFADLLEKELARRSRYVANYAI